ncbi:MAG: cytidine deaminase [Bacteroidota bacterium]
MKKRSIGFELLIFEKIQEMSQEDQKLLQRADKALESSYSPYSNFKVGAAVLLENGTVVLGSNQENASYPAGLCAERVAVFSAGAQFPNVQIQAIAISAASTHNFVSQPAGPCGSCRQAILEYEVKQKSPIAILMKGQSGPIYKCGSIAALLPLSFDHTFLGDT